MMEIIGKYSLNNKLENYLKWYVWCGKGNNTRIQRGYNHSSKIFEIRKKSWGDLTTYEDNFRATPIDVITIEDILKSSREHDSGANTFECANGEIYPLPFPSSSVIYHIVGSRVTMTQDEINKQNTRHELVYTTSRARTADAGNQTFLIRYPQESEYVTCIQITNYSYKKNGFVHKSLWSCKYEDLCYWDKSLEMPSNKYELTSEYIESLPWHERPGAQARKSINEIKETFSMLKRFLTPYFKLLAAIFRRDWEDCKTQLKKILYHLLILVGGVLGAFILVFTLMFALAWLFNPDLTFKQVLLMLYDIF